MGPSAINTFDRGTPDTLLSSQLGFARGVSAQGHQGYDGMAHPREKQEDTRIRNVWKHNLRQEMATLRALVEEYPYIAMVSPLTGVYDWRLTCGRTPSFLASLRDP